MHDGNRIGLPGCIGFLCHARRIQRAMLASNGYRRSFHFAQTVADRALDRRPVSGADRAEFFQKHIAFGAAIDVERQVFPSQIGNCRTSSPYLNLSGTPITVVHLQGCGQHMRCRRMCVFAEAYPPTCGESPHSPVCLVTTSQSLNSFQRSTFGSDLC